jgi:hypothetical protein
LNSEINEDFRQCYRKLPRDIRHQARVAYALFRENPRHGSLQFKKIAGPIYSARIGLTYRAVGILEDDTIIWFWIGSHAEYDHILKHL